MQPQNQSVHQKVIRAESQLKNQVAQNAHQRGRSLSINTGAHQLPPHNYRSSSQLSNQQSCGHLPPQLAQIKQKITIVQHISGQASGSGVDSPTRRTNCKPDVLQLPQSKAVEEAFQKQGHVSPVRHRVAISVGGSVLSTRQLASKPSQPALHQHVTNNTQSPGRASGASRLVSQMGEYQTVAHMQGPIGSPIILARNASSGLSHHQNPQNVSGRRSRSKTTTKERTPVATSTSALSRQAVPISNLQIVFDQTAGRHLQQHLQHQKIIQQLFAQANENIRPLKSPLMQIPSTTTSTKVVSNKAAIIDGAGSDYGSNRVGQARQGTLSKQSSFPQQHSQLIQQSRSRTELPTVLGSNRQGTMNQHTDMKQEPAMECTCDHPNLNGHSPTRVSNRCLNYKAFVSKFDVPEAGPGTFQQRHRTLDLSNQPVHRHPDHYAPLADPSQQQLLSASDLKMAIKADQRLQESMGRRNSSLLAHALNQDLNNLRVEEEKLQRKKQSIALHGRHLIETGEDSNEEDKVFQDQKRRLNAEHDNDSEDECEQNDNNDELFEGIETPLAQMQQPPGDVDQEQEGDGQAKGKGYAHSKSISTQMLSGNVDLPDIVSPVSQQVQSARASQLTKSRLPKAENVTSPMALRQEESTKVKPPASAIFRSFMVSNDAPSPSSKRTSLGKSQSVMLHDQKVDRNLVSKQDYFTLKKFELKKKASIEDASKLPRNLRKYIEKINNEDSFVQLDIEKAVQLANAQGNMINLMSNQANPGQLAQHTNERELLYACYIPGMKAHTKAKFGQQNGASGKTAGAKQLQRIERELDHSDTKRSDIKRVLMRFNKDQMMGYRLEMSTGVAQQNKAREAQKSPSDDKSAQDFMTLMDKRCPTIVSQVWPQEHSKVLKELKSKYLPLYDLKMNSKIEDIEPRYTLEAIAKVQKVEHALKMEKIREKQRKDTKEKQAAMQFEIERRSKIFEQQRAKNLLEAQRVRQIQLATQFKLNDIQDLANYVQYDTDQINMVAEKTLHDKHASLTSKASLTQLGKLTQLTNDDLPQVANEEKEAVESNMESGRGDQDTLRSNQQSDSLRSKKKSKTQGLSKCPNKSRVQLFGDQILVFERSHEAEKKQFSALGNLLQKSTSKTQLRQVKILPHIPQRNPQVGAVATGAQKQMVYNTVDGCTQVVTDLSQQLPKAQGDFLLPARVQNAEQKLLRQQQQFQREREIAKTMGSTKTFRKSQTDLSKVTPQSKLRYPDTSIQALAQAYGPQGSYLASQELSVGAHNIRKNIVVSEREFLDTDIGSIAGARGSQSPDMVGGHRSSIKAGQQSSPSIFDKSSITQVLVDSQELKKKMIERARDEAHIFAASQGLTTSARNQHLVSPSHSALAPPNKLDSKQYGKAGEMLPTTNKTGFKTKLPQRSNVVLRLGDFKAKQKMQRARHAGGGKHGSSSGGAQQSLFKYKQRSSAAASVPDESNFQQQALIQDQAIAQMLLDQMSTQIKETGPPQKSGPTNLADTVVTTSTASPLLEPLGPLNTSKQFPGQTNQAATAAMYQQISDSYDVVDRRSSGFEYKHLHKSHLTSPSTSQTLPPVERKLNLTTNESYQLPQFKNYNTMSQPADPMTHKKTSRSPMLKDSAASHMFGTLASPRQSSYIKQASANRTMVELMPHLTGGTNRVHHGPSTLPSASLHQTRQIIRHDFANHGSITTVQNPLAALPGPQSPQTTTSAAKMHNTLSGLSKAYNYPMAQMLQKTSTKQDYGHMPVIYGKKSSTMTQV